MYYGASDREGLKRSFTYAVKMVAGTTFVVGVILFFAAPLLARVYTSDPEVISLSVFSLRCMALGMVPDGLSEVFQDYLQGVQNRKMVNILCFAERFFIPVLMAWALGMAFGSKGIMASVAVGKALLLVAMYVYLCIRKKGAPKQAEDFMLLKEDFGGSTEDNLTAQIRTMDDVMRESRGAETFCLDHGVDARQSKLMALFVEEMAGNIVSHGKPRNRSGVCVDYRLYASKAGLCLSLRDYCEAFDPMKYYEIHKDGEADENLGIRMVMKLAKDIRYINTFNSNCLFINLEV